jgi:hypothetical protein
MDIDNENEDDAPEEVDMAAVVAEVLAGCDPAATHMQRDRMNQHMQQHREFVTTLLDQWTASADVEERRNAQMVVGFMQLNQMRSNQNNNEQEIIPKNAPRSIHYLLNANQRAKIKRLAATFKDKYGRDFSILKV